MHSSSLSVASTQDLVKSKFSSLVSIRNETSCNGIFKTILKKKEHLKIFQLALLQKQHAPICLEVD